MQQEYNKAVDFSWWCSAGIRALDTLRISRVRLDRRHPSLSPPPPHHLDEDAISDPISLIDYSLGSCSKIHIAHEEWEGHPRQMRSWFSSLKLQTQPRSIERTYCGLSQSMCASSVLFFVHTVLLGLGVSLAHKWGWVAIRLSRVVGGKIHSPTTVIKSPRLSTHEGALYSAVCVLVAVGVGVLGMTHFAESLPKRDHTDTKILRHIPGPPQPNAHQAQLLCLCASAGDSRPFQVPRTVLLIIIGGSAIIDVAISLLIFRASSVTDPELCFSAKVCVCRVQRRRLQEFILEEAKLFLFPCCMRVLSLDYLRTRCWLRQASRQAGNDHRGCRGRGRVWVETKTSGNWRLPNLEGRGGGAVGRTRVVWTRRMKSAFVTHTRRLPVR